MSTRSEDYTANWRGARRYRFDEEYRLKLAAAEERHDRQHGTTVHQQEMEQTFVEAAVTRDRHGVEEVRTPGMRPRNSWLVVVALMIASFGFMFIDWSSAIRVARELLP